MPEPTKELATVQAPQSYLGLDFAQIKNVAQALALSGIFDDAKDANVAFAKVLAGQELGLTPFQSLQEISFIKGKPNVSANVKAAKIKASGKYNYRVTAWDTTHCEIEFYELGKAVGKVDYTEADAKRSGVYDRNSQYKTGPKAMYFAGAIRQGQRAYCPDTMGGIPTYDREELEIVEGEIVEPAKTVARETPPEPTAAPVNVINTEDEEFLAQRFPTEEERAAAAKKAEEDYDSSIEMITAPQQRKIFAILNSKDIKDAEQQKSVVYGLVETTFGKKITSGKELTKVQAIELITALEAADGEELKMFFAEAETNAT